MTDWRITRLAAYYARTTKVEVHISSNNYRSLLVVSPNPFLNNKSIEMSAVTPIPVPSQIPSSKRDCSPFLLSSVLTFVVTPMLKIWGTYSSKKCLLSAEDVYYVNCVILDRILWCCKEQFLISYALYLKTKRFRWNLWFFHAFL